MKNIVEFHNDLINEKLGKLSGEALDLLMTICSLSRDKGNELIISYSILKNMSQYSHNSNKILLDDLIKLNESLCSNFVFTVKDENNILTTESIFRFLYHSDYLEVHVSNSGRYILNNLTENFTRFELEEFVNLESKYSKRLYKLLKQFRSTGIYITTKEQLYKDLDIPKTYTNSNFNRQIYKPMIEELKKYFIGLNVEVRKGGRGGAVKGYTFTFQKEFDKNTDGNKKSSSERSSASKNNFNNFHQQQIYDFDDIEKKLVNN